MTVERSVGVSELSRMVFTASTASAETAPLPEQTVLSPTKAATADEPAVIQVSGDPGRAYRISLPDTIEDPATNATITGFTVWSRNSGDITTTLSARMDDEGRDTLRVTGVMRAVAFIDISAAVPITVNYE